MRSHGLIRFIPVVLMIALSRTVLAAPQILAVLATDGAIPLSCADGVCEAELSTYCLQRHRPAPVPGTVYRPGRGDAITLVVTAANGDISRIPAAPYLTISQQRSYTAALIRLPQTALAAFAGVAVAIEVRGDASLVPVPRPGDDDPLSAAEIAHATGPLRALGGRIVDNGGAVAGAARIVARLVNVLPRNRRPGATERDAAWRAAVDGRRTGPSGGSALRRARADYDRCLGAVADHSAISLRGCLEARHDRLMRRLNDDYWKVGAGS